MANKFGDPGLVGECIWLSNILSPPLGKPFADIMAVVGVGIIGIEPVIGNLWVSTAGNALLDGLFGDSANGSGPETDIFLRRKVPSPVLSFPKLSGAEGTLPMGRVGDGSFGSSRPSLSREEIFSELVLHRASSLKDPTETFRVFMGAADRRAEAGPDVRPG